MSQEESQTQTVPNAPSYAIVQTGGKQYRMEVGRFYDIELLRAAPDESVTLTEVLLVHHAGTVTVGRPFVAGATVQGRVVNHLKAKKVIVYKMKPKKKTRKKNGHRQPLTRFLVDRIEADVD
jgi:large subunit ribosomal protein L21